MAQYIGGDISEITCNHPTLGNFNFGTKSNESYTIDPGGLRSNDDSDAVSGDGQMIDQISNKRWSLEGVFMADFISKKEIENLPLLAGSPEQATWTITHISGAIWKGRGKFVGDIQADTMTAQISGKVSGGGKLESL